MCIRDRYYTFVDGRMQTGWYKLPVQAAAESGEAQTATPSEAAPVSEPVSYTHLDVYKRQCQFPAACALT